MHFAPLSWSPKRTQPTQDAGGLCDLGVANGLACSPLHGSPGCYWPRLRQDFWAGGMSSGGKQGVENGAEQYGFHTVQCGGTLTSFTWTVFLLLTYHLFSVTRYFFTQKIIELLPKMGILSFAILAIRSLTRSLQLSRFRLSVEGTFLYGHVDSLTELA